MNKQEFLEEATKVFDHTQTLSEIVSKHNDIIIIGNGGSNAIASHITQDYTKQLGKRAFSFSDPSRLTCYINDYGMENAYCQFLKEFCTKTTLVILMSSSGMSSNILRCASWCIDNEISMISLSGFKPDNVLRTMCHEKNLLNVHVSSFDYGVVECTHELLLHSIL